MKSLLFQDTGPLQQPPGCGPCRTEIPIVLRKGGRLYRFILRDKISIEDPYLVLVKAAAFAIRTGEPFGATPPAKSVRDFLIKTATVI
jgi:hypothetical protein